MDNSPSVATEAERWQRFGRFVRTYREDQARVSQKEAAKGAGMTRQQWNRIERGISGSKRTTVIKIAEALKADPLPFLNQAGFVEPDDGAVPAAETNDLEVHRLARYYAELPRECQLDVMALTEALWRRRRAEGRAERSSRKDSGKHRPQRDKPGVMPRKRRTGTEG